MRKNRLACIFVGVALAAPAAAAPPTPPPRPSPASSPVSSSLVSTSPVSVSAEPSPEAKAAFLALSEADRKAMQDALGWLGFYNGVVDGALGKRTIEALIAYQQSIAASANGVATSKQLGGVKSAAAKVKADVGFKVSDDPATGIRLGAPLKLLDKRESGPASASLGGADGQIGLYLKQTSGDLAALFQTMTTAPNRKVSYKYLKPDAFFVVAGEEGDKKFYRRYAVAPTDAKTLRGFAFLYPKSRAKALDPIALAIANSFEPFPSAAPPQPTPTPTPEPARLTAVALIVKPGEVVTTLPAAQCRTPTISGKPAHFLDGAEVGGLTRLAGDFGARAIAPAVAAPSDDLVALSLALVGEAKTVLQIASASPAPGGGRQIVAALGPVATGAPLFDRSAHLVGFVAPGEPTTRRGDVVLAGPHLTISAAGLGEAETAPVAQEPLSASQIGRLMREAVVGIFCGP